MIEITRIISIFQGIFFLIPGLLGLFFGIISMYIISSYFPFGSLITIPFDLGCIMVCLMGYNIIKDGYY